MIFVFRNLAVISVWFFVGFSLGLRLWVCWSSLMGFITFMGCFSLLTFTFPVLTSFILTVSFFITRWLFLDRTFVFC